MTRLMRHCGRVTGPMVPQNGRKIERRKAAEGIVIAELIKYDIPCTN
jgi:hypothetical protein